LFNLFNFKEMMKNFSEFGTPLTRVEAKKVVAGSSGMACMVDADCPEGVACLNGVCGTGEAYCRTTCSTTCPNGSTITIDCDGNCTSVNQLYVICHKANGKQEKKMCP